MLALATIWPLLYIAVGVTPSNFEIFNAGLPELDGSSVGCFGDLNGDKHTDVFTISSEGTLQVYLYEKASLQFVLAPHATISETFPIANCIPGDFNYDGKLDVLVQGPSERGGFRGTIHLGYLNVFATSFDLPETLDQVMVMDANNDLLPDLYGMSTAGSRVFWVNTPASDGVIKFVESPHQVEGFDRLSKPHSNAFIDLDGDCLPDLFLDATNPEGERRFEVWINQGTPDPLTSFKLDPRNTFLIPAGTGQTTFADFDGDGAVDVMFPICEFAECQNASVHILYNAQAPLCNADVEGYCRPIFRLCLQDTDFKFNISSPSQHTTLPRALFQGFRLTSDADLPPLMIRTADLNMDGYPDLLLPLTDDNGVSTLTLWLNVVCDLSACHPQATAANRRTFRREFDGNELLLTLAGSYAGAAFDLHDDGTQDLIVLQRLFVNQSGTVGPVYSAVALATLRHMDSYFLTTLGSNGVCETMCPTDQWPEKFPNPKPYGVSQAGVTVKFTVSDLQGVNWLLTGAQLSQSAYLSLQLPYTLFGLGRTNSYIEELAVGFPITGGHHSRQFSALIPNSQLAIFPWPPNNDQLWVLELFLSSGDWIAAVILALFVVLFLLGTVTLVLHFRAQRDSQEESSRARLFAF